MERDHEALYHNVHKIGQTSQTPSYKRIRNYPKNSILEVTLPVNNAIEAEKQIISAFKYKFTQRRDLGNEYFQGSLMEMTQCIIDIVTEHNTKYHIMAERAELARIVKMFYDIPDDELMEVDNSF